MPRAGEPVADRRKGPRALSPVALSFFDGTSVVHGTRTVGSSTGVRSTADSVLRSRDSDRANGRSRPMIAWGHGRGDSPGAHAVRSTADSVPRSRDSDRANGRSRPMMAWGHGRGDSPGAHALLIDSRASHPVVFKELFAHSIPRTRLPMDKYVYSFGRGKAEGSSLMRNLLGGKGCELAEMTNLGIPVPPGFTITTQAWAQYSRGDRRWPEGLWEQVVEALTKLEGDSDLKFGDPQRPLLVSVRSGARVSMPGMMETVLNLGLNDKTVEGLTARTRNDRFAWDCYRRFITMFGNVVLGIRREVFDEHLDAIKRRLGVHTDPEVLAEELRKLTAVYKELVLARTGAPFPQDGREQLRLAINAVFDSWFAKKAVEYRRIHNIPSDWGTAVSV